MHVDDSEFNRRRRQPYISETAFVNTLASYDEDYVILGEKLAEHAGDPFQRSLDLRVIATNRWFAFRLKYTAGVDPSELALELEDVVVAFERYSDEVEKIPEERYFSPFPLDDAIDEYVDYLSLLSVSLLLHREDLVLRISVLIFGTDYDGEDAVIEELNNFFIPDRPQLDHWIWEKPYRLLLDAIDAPEPAERAECMKSYVKRWYRDMKGQAHFWGKHQQSEDSFSPYCGYWAMCAGAFSYLYDIDDSSYREELVYPKDLVDFARSIPRQPVDNGGSAMILRVLGGQRCPKDGMWFSPAKEGSM